MSTTIDFTNLAAIEAAEKKQARQDWRDLVALVADGQAGTAAQVLDELRKLGKTASELESAVQVLARRRELARFIADNSGPTPERDAAAAAAGKASQEYQRAAGILEAARLKKLQADGVLARHNDIQQGRDNTVAASMRDLMAIPLHPELAEKLKEKRAERLTLANHRERCQNAINSFDLGLGRHQPSHSQQTDLGKLQTEHYKASEQLEAIDAAIHDIEQELLLV